MSVFTEAWTNPPLVAATVTPPGGTTAPAPGTVETWTMAGGFASFPQAIAATVPPSIFRVYDRDQPAEPMLVTQTAGATWTVTRGDQGTPTVAHAPGFEVLSLISPAGLAGLAAGLPSRNGLVLPAASRTGLPQQWNNDGVGIRHTLASLLVPGGEAVAGSVYEATAWGKHITRTGADTFPRFGVNWGATPIGGGPASFTTLRTPANEQSRWKVHTLISILTPGNLATVNASVWLSRSASVEDYVDQQTWVARYMFGDTGPGTGITTGTAQTLTLWHEAVTNTQEFWQFGAKAWRLA